MSLRASAILMSFTLITLPPARAAVVSSDVTSFNSVANSLGIGTTAPAAALDVALKGTAGSAIIVPRDTVANRPTTPVNGMLRYASDAAKFEMYQAGAWQNLTGVAAGGATLTTLTDAATVNLDASQGNVFLLTLTGNHAIANPTNLTNGATYTLRVTQDGTGNRTLSWGSNYLFGTNINTLSNAANAVSVFTFHSDGTKLFATGAHVTRSCVPGSQTFAASGSYAVTLPTGCSTFTAKLWGAGGGGGGGGFTNPGQSGGGGGYTTAALTGFPDSAALFILVGGSGGGGPVSGGGGGGGRSAIRYNSGDVVVAGGGGGGGGGSGYSTVSTAGGGGGGASGASSNAAGGTQGGPGAGGTISGGGQPGNNGSGNTGGSGGNATDGGTGGVNGGGIGSNGQGYMNNSAGGGGGGGGGFFGGGGGAWTFGGGGGGGGSGYVGGGPLTVTTSNTVAGSGATPGSTAAPYNGTAGVGGGSTSGNALGLAGTDGMVVISYP